MPYYLCSNRAVGTWKVSEECSLDESWMKGRQAMQGTRASFHLRNIMLDMLMIFWVGMGYISGREEEPVCLENSQLQRT